MRSMCIEMNFRRHTVNVHLDRRRVERQVIKKVAFEYMYKIPTEYYQED